MVLFLTFSVIFPTVDPVQFPSKNSRLTFVPANFVMEHVTDSSNDDVMLPVHVGSVILYSFRSRIGVRVATVIFVVFVVFVEFEGGEIILVVFVVFVVFVEFEGGEIILVVFVVFVEFEGGEMIVVFVVFVLLVLLVVFAKRR